MGIEHALVDRARKTALLIGNARSPVFEGAESVEEMEAAAHRSPAVSAWIQVHTNGEPEFKPVFDLPEWECHEHPLTPGWSVWSLEPCEPPYRRWPDAESVVREAVHNALASARGWAIVNTYSAPSFGTEAKRYRAVGGPGEVRLVEVKGG